MRSNRIVNILFSALVLLVAVCINRQHACAQDATPDFKQVVAEMRKQYEQVNKVHIVMHVQVFENATAKSPFYNEKVEVQKDNKNYRYHFGEQDMLMNEKYLVIVDRAAREIVCSKRDLKAEALYTSDPYSANLDSLFSFYGTPVYKGKEGQQDHFSLLLKKGEVSSVEMFINTSSRLITRIEYYYRDKQHAVIDFTEFNTSPQFDASTFDEQAYVSISKGSIKPSKNFAKYHVANVENDNEASN